MTDALGTSITKREREVLELLGAGMSNKEIAAQLALAARTVETHVERVMGKLGVSSRTRAIIEARRMGLLEAVETAGAGSSAETPPNNLPLQLTRLLGREQDVAEVASLLDAHRLVTLTGPGGVGKTRLALGVGADLLEHYPQGVWFSDFSASSDAQFIGRAVGKVFGIHERPDKRLSEQIVRTLKRRHALLIFDNCEHLMGAVAELADEILHSCQNIRILTTSRASLAIIGEIVYRVRSLAFPEESTNLNADSAIRYGAIELFVDRARAIENRFTLTDENATIVGQICRRLEGIPLAIELAAARTTALSVESLSEKLVSHLNILNVGGSNILPRHQTMRALIDWSYDHLSKAEQTLFRRLAIFAGGFRLELASAVCADENITEVDVLDLLAALIDKSLVQTEFENTMRYRLPESTRQYAREKLDEASEYDALAHAHGAAMLELAEQLDAIWESTPDANWFAQGRPELENWRVALEWTLHARGDRRVGQRIAGALDVLWMQYAEVEGWHWVRAALETLDEQTPPAIRARLNLAEAKVAGGAALFRNAASLASAERALAYYTQLDDARRLASAQRYKGHGLVHMHRVAEGEALLHIALRTARALGARKLAASVLETLGLARLFDGDASGACDLWTDAQALMRDYGAGYEKSARVATLLAEAKFCSGKSEEALLLVSEAVEIYRTTDGGSRLCNVLSNAAAYLVALGHFSDARARAREALVLTRELGSHRHVRTMTIQHLAAIAALRLDENGPSTHVDHMRAAYLLGFVDASDAEIGLVREYTEQQEYDLVLAALHNELGVAGVTKLMEEGRAWGEDQAVAEALRI